MFKSLRFMNGNSGEATKSRAGRRAAVCVRQLLYEEPVRTSFRVREGRVVEWVDRFSWLTLIAQLGRSLPAILRHRLRG